VLVAVALVAFILVNGADFTREGGVNVGVKTATAACTGSSPQCLPHMTMTDIDGKAWGPAELEGKIVLVNIWATWCKPCQAEIPDLAAIYKRYKDYDVVILGLLSESIANELVRKFMSDYGVNYPVIPMTPELQDAFANPNALPTTFVYDTTGALYAERRGALEIGEIEAMLDDLFTNR
jgi:thiol-disulfide isomerase/thioredoxin